MQTMSVIRIAWGSSNCYTHICRPRETVVTYYLC